MTPHPRGTTMQISGDSSLFRHCGYSFSCTHLFCYNSSIIFLQSSVWDILVVGVNVRHSPDVLCVKAHPLDLQFHSLTYVVTCVHTE